MNIAFVPLPTEDVARIRATMRDAYGEPVETHIAGDEAYPCRHCLGQTPPGEAYLILAHRPFQSRNPYAETGPIFLCAAACPAPEALGEVPAILRSPRYLVRGYDAAERIVYGTGEVTETPRIPDRARTLLADPRIAFVEVRSASNNCFQCRIVRRD
jgi:hypothetical protein